MRNACVANGIAAGKQISPHSLRATGMTRAFDAGVPEQVRHQMLLNDQSKCSRAGHLHRIGALAEQPVRWATLHPSRPRPLRQPSGRHCRRAHARASARSGCVWRHRHGHGHRYGNGSSRGGGANARRRGRAGGVWCRAGGRCRCPRRGRDCSVRRRALPQQPVSRQRAESGADHHLPDRRCVVHRSGCNDGRSRCEQFAAVVYIHCDTVSEGGMPRARVAKTKQTCSSTVLCHHFPKTHAHARRPQPAHELQRSCHSPTALLPLTVHERTLSASVGGGSFGELPHKQKQLPKGHGLRQEFRPQGAI